MCGILDANSAHEVFGTSLTAAGEDFLGWINSDKGSLVVGGKQLDELRRAASDSYEEWAEEAVLDGRLRVADISRVAAETDRLKESGDCKSNDEHVIALAIISGARMLYSHDRDLQVDFKSLLPGLPGKVFPTGTSKNAGRNRKGMLQSDVLCWPRRCRRRR